MLTKLKLKYLNNIYMARLIQKKDITRKIDEEYYYHKGEYTEDNLESLRSFASSEIKKCKRKKI